MNLPEWTDLGPNHKLFDLGNGVKVWFSYRTPIAFQTRDDVPVVVSQNIWGRTTGGHLNQIQMNLNERVNNDEFNILLEEAMRFDE